MVLGHNFGPKSHRSPASWPVENQKATPANQVNNFVVSLWVREKNFFSTAARLLLLLLVKYNEIFGSICCVIVGICMYGTNTLFVRAFIVHSLPIEMRFYIYTRDFIALSENRLNNACQNSKVHSHIL